VLDFFKKKKAMFNFKRYYVNGKGGMFWNTLMYFFNKLQESKEAYFNKKQKVILDKLIEHKRLIQIEYIKCTDIDEQQDYANRNAEIDIAISIVKGKF
jgi:hypothetical protein